MKSVLWARVTGDWIFGFGFVPEFKFRIWLRPEAA
jgi:hypothetical protein